MRLTFRVTSSGDRWAVDAPSFDYGECWPEQDTFDHAAFWDWARTRDYPVYVSESTAPDDFAPIWERQKRSIMKMHDCEYRTRRECVFVHERFCEKETNK